MNVHSKTAGKTLRDGSGARPRGSTLPCMAGAAAACVLTGVAGATTSNGYNMPIGVTDLSVDIYQLHMMVFWICVAIAVIVFGAMIYSIVRFRHSRGAVPDTTLVHSTKVEIIWTIVPCLILIAMAIPAAESILKIEDTRHSDLSIRVTGYQWKWQYQYMGAAAGINYFSTLSQDSNFARQLHSGIDPNTVPNYLLSVDHPLVIPSGVKVRLLLTSEDVIHAWWVPDFGMKRAAIPGFISEMWIRVLPGKEGVYRGQCAALCGRDHGFMPIVVDVKTAADFQKWVAQQKAALQQPAAPATTAIAAPVSAAAAPAPSAHASKKTAAERPAPRLTAQVLN